MNTSSSFFWVFVQQGSYPKKARRAQGLMCFGFERWEGQK
jgi:hypothetical protein